MTYISNSRDGGRAHWLASLSIPLKWRAQDSVRDLVLKTKVESRRGRCPQWRVASDAHKQVSTNAQFLKILQETLYCFQLWILANHPFFQIQFSSTDDKDYHSKVYRKRFSHSLYASLVIVPKMFAVVQRMGSKCSRLLHQMAIFACSLYPYCEIILSSVKLIKMELCK